MATYQIGTQEVRTLDQSTLGMIRTLECWVRRLDIGNTLNVGIGNSVNIGLEHLHN
jgi:hypothetical protein